MNDPVVTLHRWEDMPKERLTDTLERRWISGERMTMAQLHLARGAYVPMHSHENEQLSYVVQGVLRFVVGGEEGDEMVVRAGEVLHIPSGIPHSAEALEDTVGIDLFSPPRQDWIDGTDHYIRQGASR